MSETNLSGTLRFLVQETIKAMKLTDLVVGTVVSSSPLAVKPDSSAPPISAHGLILTSGVKERIVEVQGCADCAGCTVQVQEGLKAGDKVMMLRVSGGHRHIVLSKL